MSSALPVYRSSAPVCDPSVESDILGRLHRLQPWKSSLAIGFEWLAILAPITAAHFFSHSILLDVCLVAWVGTRQHALLVLMHEGAHFRLSNRRTLNEFMSEAFLAWPLFITMNAYRQSHLAHHRFLNSKQDPDWVRKQGLSEWELPLPKFNFAKLLLRDALGGSAWYMVKELVDLSKTTTRTLETGPSDIPTINQNRRANTIWMIRILYYAILATVLSVANLWTLYGLYWVLPAFTMLQPLLRFRTIAEHYAIPQGIPAETRTTLANRIESWLLAPHQINFHAEHHLYPSVPFYNLPELHQELVKDPQYHQIAHISSGYGSVVRECVK